MNVYLVTTLNIDTKQSEVDRAYSKEEDARKRVNELNKDYLKKHEQKVALVIVRIIH